MRQSRAGEPWRIAMTLVSYAHDFIYLRTRKTASTSTEMYLQPFCMPPGRSVAEYSARQIISKYGIVGRRLTDKKPSPLLRAELRLRQSLGKTNWAPHMRAKAVRDGLDPAFWDRALKISSVRNPFTRAVSAFYWRLETRGEEPGNHDEVIRKFRNMVRKGGVQGDRDIVMIGKTFVPEVLIRQEFLADDLQALAERLSLDTSRTSLPVTKKTRSSDAAKRPSLAEMYDEETADIVRKRFDWVFTHANYPLDVPQ
jgi:Sulfotransferase family